MKGGKEMARAEGSYNQDIFCGQKKSISSKINKGIKVISDPISFSCSYIKYNCRGFLNYEK